MLGSAEIDLLERGAKMKSNLFAPRGTARSFNALGCVSLFKRERFAQKVIFSIALACWHFTTILAQRHLPTETSFPRWKMRH
jgi:hypothetical protein